MRLLRIFLIFISAFTILSAQGAEDYFPENPGFKWYYAVTPLDSLSQPQQNLTVIEADSFAVEGNFYGKEAKLILSKTGGLTTINQLPFTDSNYVAFEGNDASVFFSFPEIPFPGDFPANAENYSAWLNFYKFGQNVGSSWDIIVYDTTVVYNNQEIPLRFEVAGKRIADETITTAIGSFDTKVFEISFTIYYVLELPPPLPTQYIEIVSLVNTNWIAEDNWIVREYQPSETVDLSGFGLPSFYIPGLRRDIIAEPTNGLVLVFPNGGETVFAGNETFILWQSLDVENVSIEFSPDAGSSWTVIQENYPAVPGLFQWTAPNTPSTTCLIKIYDSDNPAVISVSADVFEISTDPPNYWAMPIEGFDAGGMREASLTVFGQHDEATDGIDIDLLEVPMTPPVQDEFDMRFILPGMPEVASRIDFRNTSETEVEWKLRFQPGAAGYPFTLHWHPDVFPAGEFFLKDTLGGNIVNIDMTVDSILVLPDETINSLLVQYTAPSGITSEISVSEGWNMISAPLLADDMMVTTLFPNAVSSAFMFNNGYIQADELYNGTGYWLKFPSPEMITVEGMQVALTNTLNEGWNMIGPFESEVTVSSITTIPSGIISSQFFGFSNGYVSSDILEPGKGYWVKASQSGEIYYNTTAAKGNYTHTLIPAGAKSIVVEDAEGYRQILYIADETFVNSELPPVPPAGAPDVRFSSGYSVEKPGAEIIMKDLNYPVKIMPDAGITLINNLTGEEISGEIVLNKFSGSLRVSVDVSVSDYSLGQNYPNPFNPATTISFSLPAPSKVKLAVYDLLGQEVAEIFSGELEAGVHEVNFNASELSSGLYVYRIQAGNFNASKKMLLMK